MTTIQDQQMVILEAEKVAEQFKKGILTRIEIDITVLQKILDDELLRDSFVITFNNWRD